MLGEVLSCQPRLPAQHSQHLSKGLYSELLNWFGRKFAAPGRDWVSLSFCFNDWARQSDYPESSNSLGTIDSRRIEAAALWQQPRRKHHRLGPDRRS